MGLRGDFEDSYAEEDELEQLFNSVGASLIRLGRGIEASREQEELRDVTKKLSDAKLLIQKFEKEARINEMKPSMLINRKKALTTQLAEFEQQKKQHLAGIENKRALMNKPKGKGGNIAPPPEIKHSQYDNMTTDQMMVKGRRDIVETEQGLIRSNKIVEDTIQVATSTAETLNSQTEQLERTLDNLDRIEFSLKHAKRVIRDITRGLATDKCIRFMTLLAIIALVVMLVLKVFKVGQHHAKTSVKPLVDQPALEVSGRKLLMMALA